jgi:hypothetical protein
LIRGSLLALLVACSPRVDPQGPGAMPDPVEGAAPADGTQRLAPRSPAPSPSPSPPPAPAEPAAQPEPPPPPHAQLQLAPVKGSTVSGTFSLVQLDDSETRILGTVTGLAKRATYTLSKRTDCGPHKADDDSRRSAPVIYGVTLTAGSTGVATVNDVSKTVHLDGPLSLEGAIFAISTTAGGKPLACGRVR